MSETNGNGTLITEKLPMPVEAAKAEPVSKKPRIDDSVEERDFDEETQKALEEIDANQNEIDALNERKFPPIFIVFSVAFIFKKGVLMNYIPLYLQRLAKKFLKSNRSTTNFGGPSTTNAMILSNAFQSFG